MEKNDLLKLESLIEKLIEKYNKIKKERDHYKNEYNTLKDKVSVLIGKLEKLDEILETSEKKTELEEQKKDSETPATQIDIKKNEFNDQLTNNGISGVDKSGMLESHSQENNIKKDDIIPETESQKKTEEISNQNKEELSKNENPDNKKNSDVEILSIEDEKLIETLRKENETLEVDLEETEYL